jgi:hypothetical protein
MPTLQSRRVLITIALPLSMLLACNLTGALQRSPTLTASTRPPVVAPTLPDTDTPAPIVETAPALSETPAASETLMETATWSLTRAPYGTPGTNPASPLEELCNAAYFVGYVGSADGAVVGITETFKKTWDVRNIGTCTWTREYRLVFFGGEHMSGPNWVPFPQVVAPGDHMFIGVTMIAPYEGGTHTSYWMLQAPDGSQFGVGERGNKPLRGSIFVP